MRALFKVMSINDTKFLLQRQLRVDGNVTMYCNSNIAPFTFVESTRVKRLIMTTAAASGSVGAARTKEKLAKMMEQFEDFEGRMMEGTRVFHQICNCNTMVAHYQAEAA